jgi:hypothetical protein
VNLFFFAFINHSRRKNPLDGNLPVCTSDIHAHDVRTAGRKNPCNIRSIRRHRHVPLDIQNGIHLLQSIRMLRRDSRQTQRIVKRERIRNKLDLFQSNHMPIKHKVNFDI